MRPLACLKLLLLTAIFFTTQFPTIAQSKQLEMLAKKRATAQTRLDKAGAGQRQADSLIQVGKQLLNEGGADLEKCINDQVQLKRRVFDSELPEAERMSASDDASERKQGEQRKAEVNKAYNAELRSIQGRMSGADKKMSEGERLQERGKEKMKLADKAYKEAEAQFNSVEKDIETAKKAEEKRLKEKEKAAAKP